MKEKCCCKCDKCYTALRVFTLLALASVATYAVIRWWTEIEEAFARLKEKVLALTDQIEIKIEKAVDFDDAEDKLENAVEEVEDAVTNLRETVEERLEN